MAENKRRYNKGWENLKPVHFTSERQPTPEAKSRGRKLAKEKRMAQKAAGEMLIAKLAELDAEAGITNKELICDTLTNIAKMGNVKAMNLLFKLTGDLEDNNNSNKTINILSQQKIFVTKEDEKKIEKHIKAVLDE